MPQLQALLYLSDMDMVRYRSRHLYSGYNSMDLCTDARTGYFAFAYMTLSLMGADACDHYLNSDLAELKRCIVNAFCNLDPCIAEVFGRFTCTIGIVPRTSTDILALSRFLAYFGRALEVYFRRGCPQDWWYEPAQLGFVSFPRPDNLVPD